MQVARGQQVASNGAAAAKQEAEAAKEALKADPEREKEIKEVRINQPEPLNHSAAAVVV